MKVQVIYTTLLQHAVGLASEEVEVPNSLTVGQLLEILSQTHGEPFNKLVLARQGELSGSILICVGNECLGRDLATTLTDGDEVTFLSAVSGG